MSRKERKAMIFLTVSVLALSFPGCGIKYLRPDTEGRHCDVYTGRSFYQYHDRVDPEDLKLKESKDMKILVSVKNGDNDQRDQDELVEEMIAAGCDVLCVNLVDRTAPSDIIKAARQEKIPVIFLNREPVKEDLMQWDQLYYVGCDAKQSGREMQGEIAADYLKAIREHIRIRMAISVRTLKREKRDTRMLSAGRTAGKNAD